MQDQNPRTAQLTQIWLTVEPYGTRLLPDQRLDLVTYGEAGGKPKPTTQLTATPYDIILKHTETVDNLFMLGHPIQVSSRTQHAQIEDTSIARFKAAV